MKAEGLKLTGGNQKQVVRVPYESIRKALKLFFLIMLGFFVLSGFVSSLGS